MEENDSVDEIINSMKNRENKSVVLTIFLYALAVIVIIALSISIYKYTDNKFRSIQNKYDALVQEIDEDIKELKKINEDRIKEMDKVFSEADSGLKQEIKLLWTSAFKKNKNEMKALNDELDQYKTNQEQIIKTVTEDISELDNKEKKIVEEIRKLETSLKENVADVRKLNLSINKTLDEAKTYSDSRIDSSIGSVRDQLQGYTLEILNIKDELSNHKDQLLILKEYNTKLQEENKELNDVLQLIKNKSIVLDVDRAAGADIGK